MWADDSQPVPVLVGARLINQSISAIAYSSQESLSLVGTSIVTAAGATGPAITFTAGSTRGASLVDVSIECYGARGVGIDTTQSLYMRDVYFRGCDVAVSQTGVEPLPGGTGGNWLHVTEWAAGVQNSAWYNSNVTYTRGVRTPGGHVRSVETLPDGIAPPTDMISRHVWDETRMASIDTPGVANARADCGARGDNVTDDTTALQTCLSTHLAVFLPPGLYRISAPLEMQVGGNLVGMGNAASFLLAATDGFPGATPASPLPLLRTSDADREGSSAAPTVIAFVGLVTWQHLAHVYTLDWRSRHPLSLWRTNFESRNCECLWVSSYSTTPELPCKLPVNITIAKSVVRGLGRFHSFVNDDTGHILSTGAAYRALRVVDTAGFAGPQARTRFYSLNLEHAQSEANGEIANASWVDVYSIKAEGNLPLLWIRGSQNVSVLALGGGTCAHAYNYSYPADFTQSAPSLFRVSDSADVKFAALLDHGYGATPPYWPPSGGDCKWTHHYPYPGESIAAYPYWTYPNVTMWNCWYGSRTATVYWYMLVVDGKGITPADKPIFFLT